MRIHYLQHVEFEDLAYLQHWASNKGYKLAKTALFKGQLLPALADFDLLVILGGPMNIYQEDCYPWLNQEKEFLRQAIDAGKKVVGICLGAQLIADALGATVVKNKYKEIGWLPIDILDRQPEEAILKDVPDSFIGFHWHGDMFNIPNGAKRIMASAGCPNQAFVYGKNVLAVQFHLEMTKESVKKLLENCTDDLTEGKFIQAKSRIEAGVELYIKQNNKLMDQLLVNLMKGDYL